MTPCLVAPSQKCLAALLPVYVGNAHSFRFPYNVPQDTLLVLGNYPSEVYCLQERCILIF